jgi:hypothetical protein
VKILFATLVLCAVTLVTAWQQKSVTVHLPADSAPPQQQMLPDLW